MKPRTNGGAIWSPGVGNATSGTWLFHMLRCMMRDAETKSARGSVGTQSVAADEPFVRALQKMRDRYQGKAIPRLELRGVKYSDKSGSTSVSGIILQEDGPEDLVTAVPVYALIGAKTILLARVFADGPETSFRVSAPAGARKIVLDPYQTILARTR